MGPWASNIAPPSSSPSTPILAATAVVAGGLGALTAAAYLHYQHSNTRPLFIPEIAPAPPASAETLPNRESAARHLPRTFSAADASSAHSGASCSYCGASEGASCPLRMPKADPFDPRPREGYVFPHQHSAGHCPSLDLQLTHTHTLTLWVAQTSLRA